MKNKNLLKSLGLVVCALLLIVCSVAGTFAYLTSKTDTIKNTFTAGNVSITMDEAKVDVYGHAADLTVRIDVANKVDGMIVGNTSKLIPGHTYTKDPTITVGANSEDCYIFFKVENGLGAAAVLNIDMNKWALVPDTTNVYYYKTVATANEKCVAFDKFTVSVNADVAALASEIITVTAYAVQADGAQGANHDAKAAWAWDVANFS